MMNMWVVPYCIMVLAEAFAASSPADTSSLRPLPTPFLPGEKLVYSVEYGFISAGDASLSVAGIDTVRGIPCYHVQSRALSNPTFSTFFKVEDRVDSYIDMYRLTSLKLEKHLREGKYRKDIEVEFDPEKPLAYYAEGDTLETYPDTQDVLSSLYHLRTRELKVGKTIVIPHHDNRKNSPLEVKVLRKEKVSVPAGKFTCFVIEPFLKDVGIFKAKGKILIWITDDERRMPVLVKASVLIGTVNAKLQHYEFGAPFDVESFLRTGQEVPGGTGTGGGEE
jgi:hypothetical protein